MTLKCETCGRETTLEGGLVAKIARPLPGGPTFTNLAGAHYRPDQLEDYEKYLKGENPGMKTPECFGRFAEVKNA